MGVGWYCDIFHPHGGSWASVTARKVTLLPPWLRPLKNMLHRVMPRYHIFRKLMARQYADHGQIMVALSRCVADDFVRFHQVAPQRIRIVYNGVDAERFSPARCAAPRRRCAAAWASAPTRCSCCWWPQISRSRGSPRCCGAWPVCVRGACRCICWSWAENACALAAAGGAAGRGRGGPFHRGGGGPRSLLCRGRPVRASHDLRHLQPGGAGGGGLRLARRHHPLQRRRRTVPRRPRHRPGRRSGRRRALCRRDPGAARLPGGAPRLGEAARRTARAQSFDRNVDNVVALYEEVVERRARPAGDPLVWSARVRMSGAVPRARPADAAHAPPPASRTAPPRQFHPDVGAPR